MSFCKYALARALMSKCVEEDELGKIFSGMTIMVAFIPFATNPGKSLKKNRQKESVLHIFFFRLSLQKSLQCNIGSISGILHVHVIIQFVDCWVNQFLSLHSKTSNDSQG